MSVKRTHLIPPPITEVDTGKIGELFANRDTGELFIIRNDGLLSLIGPTTYAEFDDVIGRGYNFSAQYGLVTSFMLTDRVDFKTETVSEVIDTLSMYYVSINGVYSNDNGYIMGTNQVYPRFTNKFNYATETLSMIQVIEDTVNTSGILPILTNCLSFVQSGIFVSVTNTSSPGYITELDFINETYSVIGNNILDRFYKSVVMLNQFYGYMMGGLTTYTTQMNFHNIMKGYDYPTRTMAELGAHLTVNHGILGSGINSNIKGYSMAGMLATTMDVFKVVGVNYGTETLFDTLQQLGWSDTLVSSSVFSTKVGYNTSGVTDGVLGQENVYTFNMVTETVGSLAAHMRSVDFMDPDDMRNTSVQSRGYDSSSTVDPYGGFSIHIGGIGNSIPDLSYIRQMDFNTYTYDLKSVNLTKAFGTGWICSNKKKTIAGKGVNILSNYGINYELFKYDNINNTTSSVTTLPTVDSMIGFSYSTSDFGVFCGGMGDLFSPDPDKYYDDIYYLMMATEVGYLESQTLLLPIHYGSNPQTKTNGYQMGYRDSMTYSPMSTIYKMGFGDLTQTQLTFSLSIGMATYNQHVCSLTEAYILHAGIWDTQPSSQNINVLNMLTDTVRLSTQMMSINNSSANGFCAYNKNYGLVEISYGIFCAMMYDTETFMPTISGFPISGTDEMLIAPQCVSIL